MVKVIMVVVRKRGKKGRKRLRTRVLVDVEGGEELT